MVDTTLYQISDSNQQSLTMNADTASYGFENNEYLPVRTYENKRLEKETTIIHQLFEPNLKHYPVDGWQTVILVLSLLLLGLAKAFSVNRFKQTYRALFNYRIAKEICSEEKVFFHRANILLTINYLVITTLFIYQIRSILNAFSNQSTSFVFYLFVFGFLLAIYLVKLIFAQVLSFVFNAQHLAVDYTFSVTLFNNLLGVLFIPVMSMMCFTSVDFSVILSYIALPVLFFVFLLRLIRLFVVGSEKGISYFYIFLYICTLEILPLVVMIKIFILK